MNDPLEDLKAVMRQLEESKPLLCYGLTAFIPAGKLIHVAAHPGHPEVVYCHPDDWERAKVELRRVYRLKDLREWRPTHDDLIAESDYWRSRWTA